MISAFYASISALLIVWLSHNVVKYRQRHRISIGDGDNKDLKVAMAAQSNAVEYIPITLILLFALEINNANNFTIHAFGIAFIVGRIIHARYLLLANLRGRVIGMQITAFVIIALAILNIIYLPYADILKT